MKIAVVLSLIVMGTTDAVRLSRRGTSPGYKDWFEGKMPHDLKLKMQVMGAVGSGSWTDYNPNFQAVQTDSELEMNAEEGETTNVHYENPEEFDVIQFGDDQDYQGDQKFL